MSSDSVGTLSILGKSKKTVLETTALKESLSPGPKTSKKKKKLEKYNLNLLWKPHTEATVWNYGTDKL